MKKLCFWGLPVIILAFGLMMLGCDNDTTTDNNNTSTTPTTTITYTVTPDGTADTVTSTKLDFTFSAAISGLTAENITITAGTGLASKGILTGSGTSWNLGITNVSAGTIKVTINKDGIESGEKTVTVHKTGTIPATTYTVTANGTEGTVTSTQLDFTFNAAISGLTADDITITAGTGLASKGILTGSGTSWSLGITNVSVGTIKVTINKDGIESGEKTVTVYEDLTVGTTKDNAISLSITQWKNGTVATGEAKWYKFEAVSGTSYRVQWKYSGNPASDNYTATLNFTAYQSDGTTTIPGINGVSDGWNSPKTVEGINGTVYLKVEPFSSYVGTYAIRFYDPAIVPPQIPMSISSTSTTPAPSVLVSWKSVSGVSGYRVYRSSAETGEYTQVGEITGDSTTSYNNNTNINAGNTYWYKVAAYNDIGEGEKSAAKSDTTPNTNDVITLYPVVAVPTDGTISTETQVDWYKFTAISGITYKVQWADVSDQTGSTYTGYLKVSAFTSDGTPISSFQNSSQGWTTGKTISGISGTVYLKVEPNISKIGTYGIKVSQQ